MTPDEYNGIVAELEELARTEPAALRNRVRLLIAGGYAYVLAVLLLVIGAAALVVLAMVSGSVAALFKLVLPLIVLAWLILKSLWVTTGPPPGRRLPRGSARALEARVEEIRRALDAPHADEVLLTGDFNASVTQIPRLGIFGWPRTYLSLGVPLMYALEPRQFDAVLAHEFAHLSGSHPKLGLWVYRMSRTWGQLLQHLEEADNWGSALFERFVGWYVPRMRAYGFVLSRRDEYEADSEAASVAGADAMGEALVALELRGDALDEQFWPDVWRQAELDPSPPTQAFALLPVVMREAIAPPVRARRMGRALARRAADGDTHPSLSERLAALGVAPSEALAERLASPVTTQAAEHYLGGIASEALAGFEGAWRAGVEQSWRQRHHEVRKMRTRVADLTGRDRTGTPLTPGELWELASTLSELDDEPAAIPYLGRILDAEPDHVGAHFVLGRALLTQDDPAGIAHVNRAMELSRGDVVLQGIVLLGRYRASRGEAAEAEALRKRYREYVETMRLAQEERARIGSGDTFLPADLPPEDLDRLREVARGEEGLSAVWVARKEARYLPEQPVIVVLLEPRWWRLGSWFDRDRGRAKRVGDRLAFSADCCMMVLTLTRKNAWLRRMLMEVAGARAYQRGT